MLRIDRDASPYHPDRAKAEVISTPQRTRTSVESHWRRVPQSRPLVFAVVHLLDDARPHESDRLQLSNREIDSGSDWSKYGLWR